VEEEVRVFLPSVPSVSAPAVPVGAHVLDVREHDEWAAGHIDGAQHIPLGELVARYAELPDDAEMVVVCRSGGRSARAVAWLVENGTDALNLDGGMGAWADAGRLMVSETGAEPFVR
jgi:rhodanese-related sulfurtransferase